MFSRFREPFSGFSHLIGAILALVGLVWLISQTWQNTPKLITMTVYGISVISVFSASAALHLIRASESTQDTLNRADHAAIYLMIAGSFTPPAFFVLPDGWNIAFLSIVWGMAGIGMMVKLFSPKLRSGIISTLSYVGMGWLAVVVLPFLLETLPPLANGLLLGGGITYTVGAVFYQLDHYRKLLPSFSFHDIWHIFVLVGSALHFAAIAHII
ncbi:MAG: hemolysin III family protein [Chloroflexi bacterium]|nr:hemolysin III family protein [Chloroflexota bacterium]